MTALAQFNEDVRGDAEEKLLRCCGSSAWAMELVSRRPFVTDEALMAAATSLWFELAEEDWLQAFACHPRIGETRAATTDYLAHSAVEQAAAQRTMATIADALARGNRLYEERFSFRYIVFASGRSAPELLQVLEERLLRTRGEELLEAARQQQRITQLRMAKWLRMEAAEQR